MKQNYDDEEKINIQQEFYLVGWHHISSSAALTPLTPSPLPISEPGAFQEEQQKAIDIFFEGNDVSVTLPTGSTKSLICRIFNIYHLSSLNETGHYIYCAAR